MNKIMLFLILILSITVNPASAEIKTLVSFKSNTTKVLVADRTSFITERTPRLDGVSEPISNLNLNSLLFKLDIHRDGDSQLTLILHPSRIESSANNPNFLIFWLDSIKDFRVFSSYFNSDLSSNYPSGRSYSQSVSAIKVRLDQSNNNIQATLSPHWQLNIEHPNSLAPLNGQFLPYFTVGQPLFAESTMTIIYNKDSSGNNY